ncbi:MAG: EpsG family protein [Paludibacteraceae bacterium]|nr:EpsG family protein [Paludibacteraceae bacterium]
MNFINISIITLLILSVLEFLCCAKSNNYKYQNLLYSLAFFIFFIISSIKLYYGADITLFVPFYDSLDTLNLSNDYLEPGTIFFWYCCKSLKISFWGMTFIINCFYFLSIWMLFKHLNAHKVFALLILVVFDYNLIFYQLRQQLAVSMFIFAFLCAIDEKYWRMLLFLCLTTMLHKSGGFFSILLLLIISFKNYEIKKTNFITALLILFLLILIPIENVSNLLSGILPSKITDSIHMHFAMSSTPIQSILAIYTLLGLLLYYSVNKSTYTNNIWIYMALMSMLTIAIFYKYRFFLLRLRSYFLPILIVYTFNAAQNSDIPKYLYQITAILLLIISVRTTLNFIRIDNNPNASKADVGHVVFELFYKNDADIKQDALKKAEIFWNREYDQMIHGIK